jgi:Fe2+ or Zn2+ uptake regulation protein
MERQTVQKQVIKDFLLATTSHPTAEKVYRAVKKKLPTISRGTVYRILNNLKEKGEVREIKLAVSHFDGNVSYHAHFICQKCGRIFDIFNFPKKLKIKKHIKIGKINNCEVYFYGLCRSCQERCGRL